MWFLHLVALRAGSYASVLDMIRPKMYPFGFFNLGSSSKSSLLVYWFWVIDSRVEIIMCIIIWGKKCLENDGLCLFWLNLFFHLAFSLAQTALTYTTHTVWKNALKERQIERGFSSFFAKFLPYLMISQCGALWRAAILWKIIK